MRMCLCLPNERSALDVQAMSKEREDRLQLVEYELRLAKEDLAAMQKRLEQVLGRGLRLMDIYHGSYRMRSPYPRACLTRLNPIKVMGCVSGMHPLEFVECLEIWRQSSQ